MKVLTIEHALEFARKHSGERDEFLERVRATLRELCEQSIEYGTFEHGTFLDQLQHELVTLRVEHGDPLAGERRARRNRKIPSKVRAKVYRRDSFTCQRCGWQRPSDPEKRAQSSRHLTIDHKIPLVEGGPNTPENMETLCSPCNNGAKGKTLPETV